MSRLGLWGVSALFTGAIILLGQISSHFFWDRPWQLDWQMALVWMLLTFFAVQMETRRKRKASR